MKGDSNLSKKEFTILLLGMTGAGKSTYINSVANYLYYETLKEAVNGSRPVCIIPTKFDHTCKMPNGGFQTITIEMEGQNAADEGNERFGSAQSATQQPRCYSFVQNDIKINILDVPGVCDTRGIETDKENKKLIIAKIQQFPEIHSIWILLKSLENRETTQFLFSLKDIFTVVPKQAIENISFVITHSKSTDFTPGQTITPLTNFIANLNASQNLNIDLNKTIFCVDSESFRYQVGWYTSPKFKADVKNKINSYEESWIESRRATLNLLEKTLKAVPRPSALFVAVHNARVAIPCFLNAATRILTTIEKNKSPSFRKKLTQQLMNGNQIQNDINVNKARSPKTICTGRNCISWTFQKDGTKKFNFNICHNNCYLSNIVHGKYPQEALIDCQIFDINENCNICGCSYRVHTHAFFDFENVEKSTKVPKMTQPQAEAWINKYLKELNAMKNAIFDAFLVAYRYLHQNSILTYNDSLEEQVNLEIRVLEGTETADPEVIKNLKSVIEKHKQMVETFQALSKNDLQKDKVTNEKFAEVINKVFALPPLGPTIKKIYDSERETVIEYSSDFTPLPVNHVPRV